MKRYLIVFLSLIFLAATSHSSFAKPANLTMLNDVNVSASVDNTKIEFKFDGRPRPEKVLFHNDFVQIEFPDTYTDPPKQWHKVEDEIVKNIFVYQFDTTTVRVRLFSFDKAGSLKNRIKISRANNAVVINYTPGATESSRALPSGSKKGVNKNSVSKAKDEPPVEVNAPETTGAASLPDESAASVEAQGVADQTETGRDSGLIKDENAHSPLQGEGQGMDGVSPAGDVQSGQSHGSLLTGKKDAGENIIVPPDNAPGLTGSVLKMVTALGIVLSLLFGAVWVAKKFLGKKMGLSGQDQKIKVVTSTYLGPKKSIAIVEVAGEKIVVGVTATHISMLTKIGNAEDFGEVLKEQIKSADEKVGIQDELWDNVKT